ncbi:MAG TPA: phosphopantetheine-binding protein [Thermoanaerobaculia bacterium]|nr:phosphopantetheine-binding protein [Thermoanaerobaculia bacterium]
MPTPHEIEETIMQAICKTIQIDRAELTPETRFDSLGASSMEVVCIVFEIEDAYDVNVVKEGRDDFKTIGDARDLLLELLARQDAGELAS